MSAAPSPVYAVRYEPLPADLPAAAMEQQLLALWESEKLFERTLAERAESPPFVFFEGPPTANGRPGIHHVFSRTIKDLVCRHRVMRGMFVARKAGWDTHGLPVEIEVEKRLGISGKQDIERLGVERFNQLCRESVWRYRADWEKLSARIGYWLDYDHPYVTYDNDYVESVWWALKSLHERGLLYRGHKILPYCTRCGTTLSSHELAQGYEDVDDPSVYVALEVVHDGRVPVPTVHLADGSERSQRRILVWTTTPWTLVSNVALAVHPDLEYVELRRRGDDPRTLVLAHARISGALGEDWRDRWEEIARFAGAELSAWRYRRPFDWVPFDDGVHEVIVSESFVSADDGSGVVHMAPAFGADDYAAGRRHGLSFVQPVDAAGQFAAGLPVVGGTHVKAADPLLVEALRANGLLFRSGTLRHSYPHCWRCRSPLLYMARSSWFVRTTAYRDEMVARNALVGWHPEEAGTGRFGEWLANNIDWALSRDRYWGTPLPVWVNDEDASEMQVIGSYEELARYAGRELPDDFDPHKPFIDAYTWPAPSGSGIMRRVPEVVDAWFDSGSMPFAQWHYPFENRDEFANNFPADFIAEGVDQTRGWFYSLLAIATGLGDSLPDNAVSERMPPAASPYGAVIVNDLVLDASGQKMSKSRGNVVEPWEVLERHGADSVRLFFVASSQVWMPRRFDEAAIRDTAGRFLLTLRNVYSGIFALYANFGWTPSVSDPPIADRPALDRWILSRLAGVEESVDSLLERYDATAAARQLMGFVVEDVSNWYVRLSRSRFYDVTSADNRAAFSTLHEVLVVTCRLLAPLAPFLSDWLHRQLVGESVHLAPYVRPASPSRDLTLEHAMAEVRELASLGRAAREDAAIRVRQPLSRVVCVVPDGVPRELESILSLLAAELNVKAVEMVNSADALVTLEARPNFRALGKKFGKLTPDAARAISALGGERLRAFEIGQPVTVTIGSESHALEPGDLTIERRASGALVVRESAGRFAAIDPAVTPELLREGIARELVSRIQRLRRDAGLEVSDRINLWIDGEGEVLKAVEEHRDWIESEVLAVDLASGGEMPDGYDATQTVELEELTARFALTRNA